VKAHFGEPVAAALVASGRLVLARSPKFHRPRGPACFRAACDGCLARVDGVPNVMTCTVPAREGLEVKTQNTLGSREVDLLRVTDWFFPKGLNHHELFAGVPGLQSLMQGLARRVAGLGKLPAHAAPARDAVRRRADVLVVGGGPAGSLVAAMAAERGRSVELVDDALEIGGSGRVLRDPAWRRIEERLARVAAAGQVVLRPSTTVGALYGDDLLVVGAQGAQIVEARALVLAPGAQDGAVAFEGNDLPGVMSARAGCFLLEHRVLPGKRVVVVVVAGGGPFGAAFAESVRARGAPCDVTLVEGLPLRAKGTARVKAITVKEGGGRARELPADAVLLDAARSPAYELCEQAGAELAHEPRGFVAKTDRGKIRDGVFAVGEAVGSPLDPGSLEARAHEIVAQI
jgi:sarcosine oxidase subunit alpha